MTLATEIDPAAAVVRIPHVAAGRLVEGEEVEHRSRDRGATIVTPALDLGALVAPRTVAPPAADVALDDVIALLDELSRRVRLDENAHLQWALETVAPLSTTPRMLLERQYAGLGQAFRADVLRAQVASAFAPGALDGWAEAESVDGRRSAVRAYAPRLVHMLAGNSPLVAAVTIAWTALVRGVGLLKMPSNDPCTAVALLRTLAEIEPDHPVVRSLSAAYWRGGDESIEGVLLRPQYFDKLVAWGGESALRSARRYIGPGLELVAFDPKSSISVIGHEAFADVASLAEAACAAAIDTTFLNQDACASSRFHYVEGSVEEADRYCEALLPQLAVERELATASGDPTEPALREEVEVLRDLEPEFRVWGDYSGAGLVVRSDEPLDAYPDRRTVNVVPVASLGEAASFATVANQTVGVYPAARKAEIRDALAAQGVQRIVTLGQTGDLELLSGLPHDGMVVLSRLVRWTVDQG